MAEVDGLKAGFIDHDTLTSRVERFDIWMGSRWMGLKLMLGYAWTSVSFANHDHVVAKVVAFFAILIQDEPLSSRPQMLVLTLEQKLVIRDQNKNELHHL